VGILWAVDRYPNGQEIPCYRTSKLSPHSLKPTYGLYSEPVLIVSSFYKFSLTLPCHYVTSPLATDGAGMPWKGSCRVQKPFAAALFSACHAAPALHPSYQGLSPLHHRTPHHSEHCVALPATVMSHTHVQAHTHLSSLITCKLNDCRLPDPDVTQKDSMDMK